MRVSIRRNFVLTLAILAAASIFSQTLRAQQLFNLPVSVTDGGREPAGYMHPPYFIHEAAGSSLSVPPATAFSPEEIVHAYGFNLITNQGAGQTIAIVDAYDDPNVESDLAVFSKQYALPSATTSNGMFRKVYATGHVPAANANWSVEISLDVEWAHAIAPHAKIILVETASNALNDLLTGVDVAVRDGASVVSMSWASSEFSGESNFDNHFVSNGVTFLAASGDNGTGVAYPAASPDVIGVGGTSLSVSKTGNYISETAWSGSGGGLSVFEHEPLYQEQFAIQDDSRGVRGVPDVSYNANPGTGYAIYDSVAFNGAKGWIQVGGTSAAVPQWAALIAIANSMRVAVRKTTLTSSNTALYSFGKTNLGEFFHPITHGDNGSCGLVCDASAGYDFVTGLGTPQVSVLIRALVAQP